MKYGKLTKCSHGAALRDITTLLERGIFVRSPEGGRSTGYFGFGGQRFARTNSEHCFAMLFRLFVALGAGCGNRTHFVSLKRQAHF
jgi:hypothetical protein